MRNFKSLMTFIAFSLLLITGCKKDINTDTTLNPDLLNKGNELSLNSSTKLSAEAKAKLARLRASLPAGYEKRINRTFPFSSKVNPEYRNMVKRALGIEATPCNANTPLNQWLNQQLSDWNEEVIFYALITGMLDFPTYDALYFENSSKNQYFGVKGEYTKINLKTFKDIKRFWNIQSDNIVLVAMHGSMLLDRDKIIRIDQILYGDSPEVAGFWADLIIELMDIFPQYRKGNHPIFTFNAFAQPSFDFPPYGTIPDKIVMGDGMQQAYTAIGYGDVAPQAILAHEYGHHIQFQLNLFGNVSSPEATRRTELMADAFSAYYLSHARGATMQWKRVKQFLQVFFNIGDCGFDSPLHHGTPTQRMAAAEWGYSVANNAQKQGHILSAQQFVKLFDAQLPKLVKY